MNVIDQLFKKSYLNMKIFFFNTIFTYLKEILKCQGVIENKVFKKKNQYSEYSEATSN